MKLTTNDEAIKAARGIEAEAMIILATLPVVLRRLADHQGGFSAAASGADTGGGGERTLDVDGDQVPLTALEAKVLSSDPQRQFTPVDPSTAARARLLDLLGKAYDLMREAGTICSSRHEGRLTAAELLKNRTAPPGCVNKAHSTWQPRSPKGGERCDQCLGFRRAHHVEAPPEIVDMWERGVKVFSDDIERALKALAHATAKASKSGKKKSRKNAPAGDVAA